MTARFSKLISGAFTIVILSLCAAAPSSAQKKARTEPLSRLLSVREQINVRERWLKTRLDTMLLPMLRLTYDAYKFLAETLGKEYSDSLRYQNAHEA